MVSRGAFTTTDLFPSLCRDGVLGNLSDGQLLERFLERGGELAEASFAALLDRHGPMVLRVCRQSLGNPEDVQDAFQATFLVLAARARSIRNHDSLASWLYGIALRVCRRIRAEAARRRAHERTLGASRPEFADAPAGDEPPFQELHEELARLPEKYRAAVVLCYLEGLTTEDASRRLGCPQGTILSRLSRARDRLRHALTRRGVAIPTFLLDPGFAVPPPAVAHELARATAQHAVRLLGGSGLGTLEIAPHVAQLARSVLATSPFRPVALLTALSAALLATGAGAMMIRQQEREAGAAQAVRAIVAQDGPRNAQPPRPAIQGNPPVPKDLKWREVPPEQRADVLETLAGRIRANIENIRTWKGTYKIAFSQYLGVNAVGGMGAPLKDGKIEPLIQQTEAIVKFATDFPGGHHFQDKITQSMQFQRIGKSEVVKPRNAAPVDGRMFTDGKYLIDFNPVERATTAFLPNHPDAQNKRIVRRWTERESRGRTSPLDSDPRRFLGTPDDPPWGTPQIYAEALRGNRGEQQLKQAAKILTLLQAEGPGGTWHSLMAELQGPGGAPGLIEAIYYSPEAGDLPVQRTSARSTDRRVTSFTNWNWQRRDGVYLPSKFNHITYQNREETILSYSQSAELVDCEVNQPLDPHQFDYQGLGIEDGDVIVDHVARTVSVWRDGEPVKLGDFVR